MFSFPFATSAIRTTVLGYGAAALTVRFSRPTFTHKESKASTIGRIPVLITFGLVFKFMLILDLARNL